MCVVSVELPVWRRSLPGPQNWLCVGQIDRRIVILSSSTFRFLALKRQTFVGVTYFMTALRQLLLQRSLRQQTLEAWRSWLNAFSF